MFPTRTGDDRKLVKDDKRFIALTFRSGDVRASNENGRQSPLSRYQPVGRRSRAQYFLPAHVAVAARPRARMNE